MAKIMVQGTGSTVGKSVLVAALCRIFKQDGYNVCPYKSQNMALNSYITLDGKEMGRAQVLQAYAAGLEPDVSMNPILLKPSSDRKCQVIVNGKVYCNSSAKEYHNLKPQFSNMLKEGFEELEKKFDIVVIEGAGSPAEINLRDRDIVNMGLAELVDAPVILVGDIDKGGVFASLVGTMVLLQDEERKRVKGTIINKFRGDIDILTPGIDMLEERTHIPNLGVVPYFRLQLEDEDGSMMEINKEVKDKIDVAMVMLPHVSNFTDLDPLKAEEDVSVRFITSLKEFGNPDLLIIPGSKNTIGDLNYLLETGIADRIKEYSKDGMVMGICGGYQMLGKTLKDPNKVESSEDMVDGLGLLPIHTVFEQEKVTTRISCETVKDGSKLLDIKDVTEGLYGYEIHMGATNFEEGATHLFKITESNGDNKGTFDGAVNNKGNVFGTYIHGIFDGVPFREEIINKLRKKKGLDLKASGDYEKLRDRELDKLADIVRASMDIDKLYAIMEIERS